MKLAVLNPKGRDPEQHFPDGAGAPDDTQHAPVNFHAFAACTGEVRVELVCDEVDSDRPALRITVHDNGPGLSAEQRDRIFEPFYTTRPTGTGLGMAIARRIVEAHGGIIAAGNGPGGGAEIILTLPRSIA